MTDEQWMVLAVSIPADDGDALLLLMREKLGFTDFPAEQILGRPDGANLAWTYRFIRREDDSLSSPPPAGSEPPPPGSGSATPG